VRRLANLASRLMPRGPFDAARQWLLFAGAYYIYRIVRGLVDGHANVAFQHARDIVNFERATHLFIEPAVQSWSLSHSFFIHVADWMYVNSHFLVTTTFLVWLYIARNHAYYFVRNMFMIAMAFAIAGYVAYPTAPPRFLPEWGFQDTVANFFGDSVAQSANVLYNPYAAVPSMHVAFALLIAVPAIKLVRNRALKLLWSLYPLLVTFVVIATGNHFWIDAALGAVVAAASAVLAATAFARARPEAWAWRRVPAEARA
jgi:membrane-associated phospholipid phosphatase